MNRLLTTLSFVLLALACTKEEFRTRQYPRVRTNAIINITSAGATFQAEILATPSEILDHGFVWSTSINPTIESGDRISLGKRNDAGSFSANVERGLGLQTYYVKAYAKSSTYLVYGEQLTFKSLGAMAPKITRFSPMSARLGDTLTVYGKNFSYKPLLNDVLFDVTIAEVVSATDTLLKVIVPQNLAVLSSTIKVSFANNSSTSTDKFTLLAPQLLTANKTTISICDTLTFTGVNLPANTLIMVVTFNDKPAPIISRNGNVVKVKTPLVSKSDASVSIKLRVTNIQNSFTGSVNFKAPVLKSFSPLTASFSDTLKFLMDYIPACDLNVKIGTLTAPIVEQTKTYFKIIIPTSVTSTDLPIKMFYGTDPLLDVVVPRSLQLMTVTPATGTFDDLIKIKGKGFHPDPSKNAVCFNCGGAQNNPAQVIASTPTELTVKVPRQLNATSSGNLSVGISVVGKSIEIANSFQLKSPIITSIDPLVIKDGTMLRIDGQNFNPNTTFNILTNLSNNNSFDIVSATSTTLVYRVLNAKLSGGGDPNLTREFDTQLNLNVSGQSVNNGQNVHAIYKGIWTKMADFPGPARRGGLKFSINNKIYYGLGVDQNDISIRYNTFYEFDPATNQWQQLADFPGPNRYDMASWTMGNIGYMAFGNNLGGGILKDTWQFDATSKVWTQLADFPDVPTGNEHATTYSANNLFTPPWVFVASSKKVYRYVIADQIYARLSDSDLPNNSLGLFETPINMYSTVNPGGGSGTSFLMKYNPILSKWSTDASIPSNTSVKGAGRKMFAVGFGGFYRFIEGSGFLGDFFPDFHITDKFDGIFSANGKIYFLKSSFPAGVTNLYELDTP